MLLQLLCLGKPFSSMSRTFELAIFQVLITGKEDPDAALPPAMDAIIRIFKRVNGLPENDGDGKGIGAAGTAFCLIRLLVASTQAISLIGKQGSLIKSIQESTGASVRVLSSDELPVYASSDERIVELQGEAVKVLKALEAVVGHLRKFLVDHSVLPLFEKSYNAPASQERQVDAWSEKTLLHAIPQTSLGADYSASMKRDSLFLDRDSQMESHIPSSRLSLYGPEHGLGSRSSTIGHSGGPVVTQIAQTMQIPLAYAEDIIGVQGTNIDDIRRTSGAILTVQESRGLPEEITVEIKGTSSQVQAAQQLIQEFIGGHREPLPRNYGKLESSLRPSYSQLGSSSYSSSSFAEQPYGGYGSSGVGGYSSFRL
ncbi:UNVERIFIED_CONTAM: RNA-binding KH domain-containing protein PEPPER [Sesamum latifolium]|uniref:RNA-binding KH domain-containing protein PEPPER n=1 Tax=Sesamum latifolium TaxID=2727402 RepID=A0AAW2VBE5_9LAMI